MKEPLKLTERQKDCLKNYFCIACDISCDLIDLCASYPDNPCKQATRNKHAMDTLKKHGLWPENSNYKMIMPQNNTPKNNVN